MRYGAVLRAVNVGTHNRVRMDALRTAIDDIGWTDVSSYLHAGNLAFTSSIRSADVVATRLEEVMAGLGLKDPCSIVRRWADLRELATETPFTGYDTVDHALTVTLCRADLLDIPAYPWEERGVVFLGGTSWALFAVVPRDLARAPSPNSLIERRYKIKATTRWWNVLVEWVAREDGAGR